MDVLPPLIARLVADISEFAASMGEADALTAKVSGSTSGTWKAAGQSMMAVGGIMAAAAGAVAVETMKSAAAFDAQMEMVHTQAGASQREVDGLKQKVLDLAGATGQGPEKLAEALFHVESVGYRGATAMAVLTQAADLAEVSGANLDDTTYGLTSVMQTFGASAQDASKYAALFNATVGAGDMRMEDFAKAVGTGFYSTGQTFGITAQSMSAALAFMTDRGSKADESSTRLRMTIALMAAPSQKATGILKTLGLTTDEVAKSQASASGVMKRTGITYSQLADDLRKPDGFYVALTHLKTALEQSGLSADAANAQLSHAFGGGKSDATLLAMLNNLDTLKSKYDAVGKGMGSFSEDVTAAGQQPKVQWQQFVATMQSLAIEVGNDLLPTGMQMVGWLKEAAQWAEQNSGVVKGLAIAIGVTLVAGLVLATAGAIAFAAATIEIWGPVALIVVGVMALVAAVLYLWTHWSQVWGWIKQLAGDVAGWIVGKWSQFTGWLSGLWASIASGASAGWTRVVGAIKGAWNAVTSWVSSAWHAVTDPIVRGWQWLSSTTATVWNAILTWFRKWWPLLLVVFMPGIALIVGLWNHFHQQVWDKVVSVWTAVTSWLSQTWSTITSVAAAAWNLFYAYTIQPVIQAYQDVTSWVSRMATAVQQWFAQAVSWVRSTWTTVSHDIAQPVEAGYQAVQATLSLVLGVFESNLNSVLSWLRGLWNSFYSVGSYIVSGIVSGVESAGSSLMSTMSGLANSALSAAKSALGIASPSKAFAAAVGQWIPKGIAVGVMQHAAVAHAAVRSFAAGLAATAAGAVSGLPGAVTPTMTAMLSAQLQAQAQHTLVVNLLSQAEVDGDTLFRHVQTKALRWSRNNGGRSAFSTTG